MDYIQDDLERYRYYRYVESIGGEEMGVTDQFKPSVKEKI